MNTPTSNFKTNDDFVFSDLLDQTFLHNNYSQNLELAKSIFSSFNDSIDSEITDLKKANDENDFDRLASISHKIKNNFIYVGAPQLKNILSDIEIEAKQKSIKVKDHISKFDTTLKVLLPAIQNEQSRLEKFILK